MNTEEKLALAETVIKNQAQLIRYLNLYIHWLNDGMTEEEFLKQAETFCKDKDPIDTAKFIEHWVYLRQIAGDIDLDDFSSMMNYDFEKLLNYVENVNMKGLHREN